MASMRLKLLLALIFLWFPVSAQAQTELDALGAGQANGAPPIRSVIELFTSQGCSSCPPADTLLKTYAENKDILTLSLPIDYWDYLGWKDTFARPEFVKRQRGYAAARGGSGIYTPQVIVNGRTDVVGTDEERIRAVVAEQQTSGAAPSITIDAKVSGDRVVVNVPAGPPPSSGHAAVWIAAYHSPTIVDVGRGENSGRKLTYYNIVERWQVLGMWRGDAVTVELPLSDIAQDGTAGLAVVLQSKSNGKPGPILGAARIDLATN